MKTYKVVLTKSYIVRIKADNEENAKEYSEFFTSDIQDISTIQDKKQYNFEIENIECKINQAFDAEKIYE